MQMVAMSVLPESPVWLKWKGQGADAVAASKRLLGGNLQGSAIEQVEDNNGGEEEPLVAAPASEVRVFPQPQLLTIRCKRRIRA